MALPLIIKAAALGGAAYAASRWLSTQSRQRRVRNDTNSSRRELPTDSDNQPTSAPTLPSESHSTASGVSPYPSGPVA